MIQAHIFYSGTVQGIGFRYILRGFAKNLNLTGWVKNLSDGRVEILIEGSREKIELLMEQTQKHFDGYIRDRSVNFKSPENLFKDFQIAR